MIFRPSLSDTAYTYWSTQFHTLSRRAQKSHSIFSVTEFVHIEPHNSAKGLSQKMNEIFNPQQPEILQAEYYNMKTRTLLPSSFIDMRDWQEEDYIQHGYPGKDPDPFLPNYTTWYSTMETKRVRQLRPSTTVFNSLVEIGTYWHIGPATNRRPNNIKEIASGTMEAIGLGYLQHPLFPKPNKIPPGCID